MLCGDSHILSHISDAFKWIFLTSCTPHRKLCLHFCELWMDVLTILWERLTFVTTLRSTNCLAGSEALKHRPLLELWQNCSLHHREEPLQPNPASEPWPSTNFSVHDSYVALIEWTSVKDIGSFTSSEEHRTGRLGSCRFRKRITIDILANLISVLSSPEGAIFQLRRSKHRLSHHHFSP